MKEAPSTTVTRVSKTATSERAPLSSLNVNVSATGKGSEIPLDSIIK